MIQQPGPATTRNSGRTPSARNAPDKSGEREYYYERNNGATWAVATRSEWLQLIRYDLWQVYCHLWGPATCAEFPYQVIQAAYEHGLNAIQCGTRANPYESGGEAVAWLRGYYDASRSPISELRTANPVVVSYRDVLRKCKAQRAAKKRGAGALRKQAKYRGPMIEWVDITAQAWAHHIRHIPNGWPKQSGMWNVAYQSSFVSSSPPIQFMPKSVLDFHRAWHDAPAFFKNLIWEYYVEKANTENGLLEAHESLIPTLIGQLYD